MCTRVLNFPLLLVCLMLLTSCNIGGSPAPAQNAVQRTGQVTWIINGTALERLQAAGLSEATRKQFFDNTHTYVIGTLPTGWHSLSTLSFTSVADLQKAFARNTIPSSVQAILYDDEAWQFTPVSEQQHVAAAVKEAAALAHSHHKLLIAAPATDLVRVLDPHGRGDNYARFLSLGIIKDAALSADSAELQAQGSEAALTTYTQFVRDGSAQAKAAHSQVAVLAGLSTNPDGQKVTGQQLTAAFQATRGEVNGYWLNIPGSQGGYCPKCGTPQPQVAIDFLRQIS